MPPLTDYLCVESTTSEVDDGQVTAVVTADVILRMKRRKTEQQFVIRNCCTGHFTDHTKLNWRLNPKVQAAEQCEVVLINAKC